MYIQWSVSQFMSLQYLCFKSYFDLDPSHNFVDYSRHLQPVAYQITLQLELVFLCRCRFSENHERQSDPNFSGRDSLFPPPFCPVTTLNVDNYSHYICLCKNFKSRLFQVWSIFLYVSNFQKMEMTKTKHGTFNWCNGYKFIYSLKMFLRAPSKIKIKLSPLDCYLCLLSAYFCILHKGYALSDFRVNFKEILLLINPTLLTIT